MPWPVREKLSLKHRLRRSYYELLRDDLDQLLLAHALTDSYGNFLKKNLPYPFVEKRELKPRARIPDFEHEAHNAFLVIFLEDSLPEVHKKYIRFFDVNKVTKANLIRCETFPLCDRLDRSQKYLESVHFHDFMKLLLPVDYALLIQRDPLSQTRDRYCLTHYHVKIDWPIADAAEDLAMSLRYISKDLYEKGDGYADIIQKKFFEYYGVSVTAGGRRSAAIVAAQYLKRLPCISTVYAGSSEARTLIRIGEMGASRSVLMSFTPGEVHQICRENGLSPELFQEKYVLHRDGDTSVCIFQVDYSHTSHARPPEDGKLREIKPDSFWLTVGNQNVLPRPGEREYPPLPLNAVYI